MRFTVAMGLIISCAAVAFAADPPTSFNEARKLAVAQDNDADLSAYVKASFNPQYHKGYAQVFLDCFKTVAQPDDRPFGFVAEIGSDGRIVRMYVDRPTNIYTCFRESFVKAQFPIPPKAPVYVSVEMQFSMPRE